MTGLSLPEPVDLKSPPCPSERTLEDRVPVEVMFQMHALIELLDSAMLTTHSVSQQSQNSHPVYETTSHVWMRPCPHCSSRLRKKSPEESWRCGCGWRAE